MATRKYTTTNTVSSPTNYKIQPSTPLITQSGGVDGPINQNFYDIDDRLYDAEDKLDGIDDFASDDQTAEEIRTALDADASGPAINAGTVDSQSVYDLTPRVMTPQLKNMLTPYKSIAVTEDISTSRGAYYFDGRYTYFAASKNFYKIDCYAPESATKVVVSSAPAESGANLVAITGDGTNLWLWYQKTGSNYHYVKWNPETDTSISTGTLTYDAGMGDIKFAVWNEVRSEMLLFTTDGYIDWDPATDARGNNSADQSTPLAVQFDGTPYYPLDNSVIPSEAGCLWILWQSNSVSSDTLITQMALASNAIVAEFDVTTVAGTSMDDVRDMVWSHDQALWILARREVDAKSRYYMLCFILQQFGSGWDIVDEWETGRFVSDSQVYTEPRMLEYDGNHMMVHSYLHNLDSQIGDKYNNRCLTSRRYTIEWEYEDESWAGRSDFEAYPHVFRDLQGQNGIDIGSSYEYDVVGRTFDGSRYWVFLNSSNVLASPKSYAVGIPQSGKNGRR